MRAPAPPTGLIATVLLFTIGMVGLIGCFLWLSSTDGGSYSMAEVRFVRAVFAVAITLPFLMAPVALLARRVHLGLVTAITTAALYVVGVGWIAVIIAFLSGFSSNKHQRIAALLPAAAVLLQGVVFVAALMALRRLPASQRRPGVVRYGVGIPVLLAVGGVLAVAGAQQIVGRFSERMVTNEAAARMALGKLHSCATAFASGSAEGLPPDLGVLGPSGTRCLDSELAQGRLPGYRIDYVAGIPDERGTRRVYAACALPTASPLARLRTLVVDDDGDVEAHSWDEEPSRPSGDLPLPCPRAWARHPLALAKTIKHCAVAFAARHPEAGYPLTLGQISREDEGCRPADGKEHEWTLTKWRVVYLSATRGADARVRGYRLYMTRYSSRGVAIVDDKGAFINSDDPEAFDVLGRRAARGSNGEAATTSILGVKLPPGYRAPEPRPNAGANAEEPDLPDGAQPEDYQGACAQGDATACYTAGKAYQRRAARGTADVREDLRRAGLAYQSACEGQMARGCDKVGAASLDGGWLEQDLPKALAWITKSCAIGYAGACSRLGGIYESGRSSTREATVKISATPGGRASSTIVTVPDPLRPAIPKDVGRAISAYSRACEMGEHEACWIKARLTRDDPSDASGGQNGFAQFASLCEGGDGAACEAAGAMVASGRAGNERPETEWRRMACVLGQTKACAAAE